jgi:hypothetical protein
MKKFILSALVLLPVIFISSSTHAQLKGFSVGPYAEAAWPSGDFSETHKNGFGLGLNADIKLPGKLGLTGSAGYMHFGGKTVVTTEGNRKMPAVNAFPVRAGLKFRMVPLIYFKVEGGVATFSGDEGSAFIVSPGVGIRILGLEVQAKYEAWMKNDYRFWGIKAGFNF